MKITGDNILGVTSFAAISYWTLALACVGHDLATGELNSKTGWVISFVFSSAFWGAALYMMLLPILLGSWQKPGKLAWTVKRVGLVAWAISPVLPIAIAVGFVVMVIFRNRI